MAYALGKHLGMSLSFGTSTKAPSLAHRYPAPSWLDSPLLQLYTGYADESLFLVYTKKILPDGSNLRPAHSSSVELGLNFHYRLLNGSLYFYAKRNTDGFNSLGTPTTLYVPAYDYTLDADGHIHYFPTGEQILYTDSRNTVSNGLYTVGYGIEYMLSTKTFRTIATRFSLQGAFTFSTYDSRNDTAYVSVDQDLINQGKPGLYGVYHPERHQCYRLITTVSSMTHIPKQGFTLTLSTDLTMLEQTHCSARSTDPLGYLNRSLEYVAIQPAAIQDPACDYLRQAPPGSIRSLDLPFVYPCVNVTLAKEIKKNIRLMLTGYNMFNIRTQYTDVITRAVTIFNQPASLSFGVSFQL